MLIGTRQFGEANIVYDEVIKIEYRILVHIFVYVWSKCNFALRTVHWESAVRDLQLDFYCVSFSLNFYTFTIRYQVAEHTRNEITT